MSKLDLKACNHCGKKMKSLLSYMTHYQSHRNLANIQFPCCIKNCRIIFKTYSTFKLHIRKAHNTIIMENKPITEINKIFQSFKCDIALCKKICAGLSQFILHLKLHLDSLDTVHCPYMNCKSSYTNRNSFASHISRKHKQWDPSFIMPVHIVHSLNSSYLNNDKDFSTLEQESFTCGSLEHYENEEFLDGIDDISYEKYLKDQALFFLKLQVKNIIPASCIQSIFDELMVANHSSSLLSVQSLSSAMSNQSSDICENVLAEFSKSEHTKINSLYTLSTNKKRKAYFHKHMSYISPRELTLGFDANKKSRTVHYVPIKDLLKMMYNKHSNEPGFWLKPEENFGIYTDLMSGSLIKDIAKSDDEILYLMLYQDSFEIVNPIGSGRKKHKILAVYLTLANIPSHKRYASEQLQLVLMCKDTDLKYFGLSKVFAPIFSELAEISGCSVSVSKSLSIKTKLLCILGDNLGSHSIGGFCENFSTVLHFCRYCLATRAEFDFNPQFSGSDRTKSSHNNSLLQLAQNGNNFEGIKFQSPFNDLCGFHVTTGLPPCLAHDIFEGVASRDMYLFVKYFVSKRWFSFNNINRKINMQKYFEGDALDKPCEVNKISCTEKLSGHAVQNWVFLRLFPLFIGIYITDFEDPVWLLYLKLKEIVEIICSPKIDIQHIAYLQVSINGYLSSRKELFPSKKLLPKHHYLSHYPQLILRYGPLMRVFTLRFEQKHSYFKKCARNFNNYKHVCKTLTETHQLLQSYNNSSIPSSKNYAVNSFSFNITNFSSTIFEAIISTCGQLPDKFSTHIVYQGTHYKKDLFLFLQEFCLFFLIHMELNMFLLMSRTHNWCMSLVCMRSVENIKRFDV
ncbi:uncharacterized protein LOC124813803 [Hydra vulgaris]|uniref:uncharacterized protein LOC124813803 n=1 Tax=Hydra vulgaris TaxID=6087 RepID=UPI0032E9F57F